MRHHPSTFTASARVLMVADWNVDARAVVEAAHRRRSDADLALLVPAKLNGLDWAGDPYASVPCAQRQLDCIIQRAHEAGVTFASADVGDPEPLAAICDALADWPAEHLVLCVRHRPLPQPFGLPARARRATGLPVELVELPAAARATRGRGWPALRSGHCALEQPQPA